MTTNPSFFDFILNASFIVKCVILILFFASVASWAIILERIRFYKRQWVNIKKFESRFWSGIAMNDLYREVTQETENDASLVRVFSAGFQEFSKLKEVGNQNQDAVMDGTQRAMQIAESDMIDQLEQPLTLLSTIGSMSPYVGLFGTVWGIMTAFQALGTMQQASIAAVAPGISEALITTALGLFAAIPASIAYNRFTQQVTRLQNRTDMFSAELTNILQRASGK
ncbi:MAG: protein TolQ [Gammaproteobacteria bacterium RIFCSPHIGHO2_02_FULL_39_13]|nr:MAG: protein TolQ [Gammaproteobacteria bacterium RIFCSPHIGHO2_02_FULL_39_13]OGT49756.1 MAG: protein TolQ [Gammaproteobacteria bacterium RIFCSPHIGHO2_12_FULL_39_24]